MGGLWRKVGSWQEIHIVSRSSCFLNIDKCLFLKESNGDLIGKLWNWTMLLSWVSSFITAVSGNHWIRYERSAVDCWFATGRNKSLEYYQVAVRLWISSHQTVFKKIRAHSDINHVWDLAATKISWMQPCINCCWTNSSLKLRMPLVEMVPNIFPRMNGVRLLVRVSHLFEKILRIGGASKQCDRVEFVQQIRFKIFAAWRTWLWGAAMAWGDGGQKCFRSKVEI